MAKKLKKIIGVPLAFFFEFSVENFLSIFSRLIVGNNSGELKIVVGCFPLRSYITLN